MVLMVMEMMMMMVMARRATGRLGSGRRLVRCFAFFFRRIWGLVGGSFFGWEEDGGEEGGVCFGGREWGRREEGCALTCFWGTLGTGGSGDQGCFWAVEGEGSGGGGEVGGVVGSLYFFLSLSLFSVAVFCLSFWFCSFTGLGMCCCLGVVW